MSTRVNPPLTRTLDLLRSLNLIDNRQCLLVCYSAAQVATLPFALLSYHFHHYLPTWGKLNRWAVCRWRACLHAHRPQTAVVIAYDIFTFTSEHCNGKTCFLSFSGSSDFFWATCYCCSDWLGTISPLPENDEEVGKKKSFSWGAYTVAICLVWSITLTWIY